MLNTVEKVEILKNVPLFSSLDTKDLVLISLVTVEEEFSEGELLFREGEEGDELFVLASGHLEVIKHDGDKEIKLADIEPGHCVGELALFSNRPRSATLRCSKSSTLLILSGVLLHELMLEHPWLGTGMIRTIVERYT